MAKKKFKVQAEVISYCYIIVEAENAEEANEAAENIDAGDFITDTIDMGGEFNVLKTLTQEVKK
jgi:hypothetical protein